MWNSKRSVKLSIVVCFILSAVLVLLAIFGPMVFKLYMTAYRGFLPDGDAMRNMRISPEISAARRKIP